MFLASYSSVKRVCGVLALMSHSSHLHPHGVSHFASIICKVKHDGVRFCMRYELVCQLCQSGSMDVTECLW